MLLFGVSLGWKIIGYAVPRGKVNGPPQSALLSPLYDAARNREREKSLIFLALWDKRRALIFLFSFLFRNRVE